MDMGRRAVAKATMKYIFRISLLRCTRVMKRKPEQHLEFAWESFYYYHLPRFFPSGLCFVCPLCRCVFCRRLCDDFNWDSIMMSGVSIEQFGCARNTDVSTVHIRSKYQSQKSLFRVRMPVYLEITIGVASFILHGSHLILIVTFSHGRKAIALMTR